MAQGRLNRSETIRGVVGHDNANGTMLRRSAQLHLVEEKELLQVSIDPKEHIVIFMSRRYFRDFVASENPRLDSDFSESENDASVIMRKQLADAEKVHKDKFQLIVRCQKCKKFRKIPNAKVPNFL